MKKKFLTLGFEILFVIWVLSFGFLAPAAEGIQYNLLQPLPGIQQVSSFPEYVQKIIPFILSLAAVLAVVMIVIGGIQYAVSEAIDAKADARDRITQAILGLLLALLSYLILYTINPQLVNLQLTIPGLNEIAPGSEGVENVM